MKLKHTSQRKLNSVWRFIDSSFLGSPVDRFLFNQFIGFELFTQCAAVDAQALSRF